MTMQDPIADLLTRVRNAQMAGHDSVDVPNSKIKRSILQVLLDEGFINGFAATDETKSSIHVDLKYHNGTPVIEELSMSPSTSLAAITVAMSVLPSTRQARSSAGA